MGTVTFATFSAVHLMMKAFLVLALLVVGGKGRKAVELSEEDAFVCMDQTALGDKFMDAMNNCMAITTTGGDGFFSTGCAAGRKGGKNKCQKYDEMLQKYIPEAETRECILSSMGWIGNAYEPIMSVIKSDIASLDETITKEYNPKTVTKCMKKHLKRATKCSNDVDEDELKAVVFYFCSDRKFARGCSKFIEKNMTQIGK